MKIGTLSSLLLTDVWLVILVDNIIVRVMWQFNKLSSPIYSNCLIVIGLIGIMALSILIDTKNNITYSKTCKENQNEEIQPVKLNYHVSIQFNDEHICSGCLISTRHVLTSAQCVHNFTIGNVPKSQLKVVVGSHKLPGGIIHHVKTVIFHPDYSLTTNNSNIAIVRLKENVSKTEKATIISLPKLEEAIIPHYGQELVASEFNHLRDSESATFNLNKFIRYAISNTACQEYGQTENLTGKFCAVLYSKVGSALVRDRGSPATLNQTYVIGILSTGRSFIGHPDIFIHVPYYLKFIKEEISKLD